MFVLFNKAILASKIPSCVYMGTWASWVGLTYHTQKIVQVAQRTWHKLMISSNKIIYPLHIEELQQKETHMRVHKLHQFLRQIVLRHLFSLSKDQIDDVPIYFLSLFFSRYHHQHFLVAITSCSGCWNHRKQHYYLTNKFGESIKQGLYRPPQFMWMYMN